MKYNSVKSKSRIPQGWAKAEKFRARSKNNQDIFLYALTFLYPSDTLLILLVEPLCPSLGVRTLRTYSGDLFHKMKTLIGLKQQNQSFCKVWSMYNVKAVQAGIDDVRVK